MEKFLADYWIYLFFGLNSLTFLLYAWDKHFAIYQKQRIPEAVLLFFALLFGGFGALCGMLFFSHKTKKPLFTILVPLFLLAQLAFIVLWKIAVIKFLKTPTI
jgi:uncharacterized membrane protein YsdA (DUF1294 family)